MIDALSIRRKLGRKDWGIPKEYEGGWRFENKHENGRVIVTYWWPDYNYSEDWLHASIAFEQRMPTYDEIKLMYEAVFPNKYAYQVFVPDEQHVTFHNYALHLWGRTDGKPLLPDFSHEILGYGKLV